MSHPAPEKKLIHCKNCGNSFHGYYCNACGQDAHTDRIDKHFIYHELQHGLLHIDKGILYTLMELFISPGRTIRLFVEGKRVRHFKPLAFLLVMAGLYAFVNHFFNANVLLTGQTGVKNADTSIQAVNDYLKEHFEIFVLLELPLISFVYYLFFKRYGTNYIEQLVINAYISGLHTFIKLLLLPVSYYFSTTGHILDQATPILILIWTYPQYYHEQPRFQIIWRAILGYVIFYFLLIIILSLVITVLTNFPKMIV